MRVLASALVAALLLSATTARANGRFPTANQLVTAPSDASTLLARTTFGFLLSRDAGKNWDWICERVLQTSQQEDPAIAITASGAILSGEFAGLMQSPDTGCAWALAGDPLAGTSVVDLVVRRDSPHAALALASRFASSDDAGNPTYTTQIFGTADDGAHWTKLGPTIDASILVETIEIAPSNPSVLYVSGLRAGAALLLASTDGGATFTEHAVPIESAHERAPFIAAVDPNDPARVYVRTSGVQANDATRLLVTKDGGATFTAVLSAKGPLQGFALSPDGSKVFAGGPLDGLHLASSTDLVFAQKNAAAISCLAHTGAKLLACSNEASGFFVGESDDDGSTFTALLHLSTIRGPVACAAGATASACAQDWPSLADQLGIGAADAGPDGGTGGGGGSSKSCGCVAVGANGAVASVLAVAIALVIAASRRRSR